MFPRQVSGDFFNQSGVSTNQTDSSLAMLPTKNVAFHTMNDEILATTDGDISHQTYPRVKYEKGFLVRPLYLNITGINLLQLEVAQAIPGSAHNHQNSTPLKDFFPD